jgi:thiamine transport system permease protein
MLTRAEHRAARTGGWSALLCVGLGLAAPVAVLISQGIEAAPSTEQGTYLFRITRFTLLQAGLSTFLSLLFAVPLARSLARRPVFPGRRWLINLFAVPLGLPPLIAALGLIEIWGRSGHCQSGAWRSFGDPDALFDLRAQRDPAWPTCSSICRLATRLILPALERLPGEYWKTAANLGHERAVTLFRLSRMAGNPPVRGWCRRSRLHALRHIVHTGAGSGRRPCCDHA